MIRLRNLPILLLLLVTATVLRAETTIVLLGDSTVAEFGPNRPMRGWGQYLSTQFDGVKTINLAISGASSKSFIASPGWEKAKLAEGDIWLIQFGHNDEPGKGDRATVADGDFKENLRAMIELARDRTAQPVLVTMPYRRIFVGDKALDERQRPYAEAVRQVAAETNTPLIDLHDESGKLFLGLGKDASARLTIPGDNTHFSEAGAAALALIVARNLQGIFPDLHLHTINASTTP